MCEFKNISAIKCKHIGSRQAYKQCYVYLVFYKGLLVTVTKKSITFENKNAK